MCGAACAARRRGSRGLPARWTTRVSRSASRRIRREARPLRIAARDRAAADPAQDGPGPSRQTRRDTDRPPARAGARRGHEEAAVQRATAHQVLRSPGPPLDTPLREEMESRLGADFSDVRVHCGPLAHELTHVIQQRQGSVPGADTGHGLRVSDPARPGRRRTEGAGRQRPIQAIFGASSTGVARTGVNRSRHCRNESVRLYGERPIDLQECRFPDARAKALFALAYNLTDYGPAARVTGGRSARRSR
ncbi:DUF4157 domain-containing protein [Streptomyces sp. NPDC085639]|uniref:DUF4157 domain-containing protein n=1 Tax=Streptomyces sp. NPDC085639 TaxID=3365734 RepID=UPI0037CD524E